VIEPDIPLNYETLRHYISRWTNHRRGRELARQAKVDHVTIRNVMVGNNAELKTLVKIARAIYQSLPQSERKAFLSTCVLQSVAELIDPNAGISRMADLTVADYLFQQSLLESNRDWKQTIHYLELAEDGYKMLSQPRKALTASCLIAQMYINLGDLQATHTQIRRIEEENNSYEFEDITREAQRLWAWYYRYDGNLLAAREAFIRCATTTREDGNAEQLESAQHLLAGVLSEM
jgi:hypothetical protein